MTKGATKNLKVAIYVRVSTQQKTNRSLQTHYLHA